MSNSDICIKLDCRPGPKRPDDIFKTVLTNTSLKFEDFTIVQMLYGEWTFKLNDDKKHLYKENYDVIISEIKNAYSKGQIRYAEWEEI